MATTGTPRRCSMRLMSMLPPLAATSSIMFRATTMGTSISRSCMVRYRFRSIFVASRILMIALGFSRMTKFRETISSLV